MKKPKRPRDTNQLGKRIVDILTGNAPHDEPAKQDKMKNLAAVELGRLGGLKGGDARAKRLSPQERSRIARRAAKARWEKAGGKKPTHSQGKRRPKSRGS